MMSALFSALIVSIALSLVSKLCDRQTAFQLLDAISEPLLKDITQNKSKAIQPSCEKG